MSKKYFGIDGVRGLINSFLMIVEIVLWLGKVVGCYFVCWFGCYLVVIGKDI